MKLFTLIFKTEDSNWTKRLKSSIFKGNDGSSIRNCSFRINDNWIVLCRFFLNSLNSFLDLFFYLKPWLFGRTINIKSSYVLCDRAEHRNFLNFFFWDKWYRLKASSHINEINPSRMVSDDDRSLYLLFVVKFLNQIEADIEAQSADIQSPKVNYPVRISKYRLHYCKKCIAYQKAKHCPKM